MSEWCARIDHELSHHGYDVTTEWSRGTPVDGHWHEGLEILFLHRGSAEFTMDGRTLLLSAGKGVVVIARRSHACRTITGKYQRTALHFAPDWVAGRMVDALVSTVTAEGGARAFHLTADAAARFPWAIGQLRLLHGRSSVRPTVEHILGMILADLETGEAASPEAPRSVVAEVVDYMRANTDSIESLRQLAARFFVSEGYLRYLFRVHVGSSPQRYWLQLKLERACEFLQSGLPVQRVAALSGFASLSGFERAFRRIMHVSPSQYQASRTRRAEFQSGDA